MGLFDIFRKKSPKEQPLKKRLASMKCKLVNYVADDFEALCGEMDKSEEYLLKLKPVNYYALKSEYIEAAFYSDKGHEENYVIFRLMKLDKPVMASGIYKISKDVLRKAYTKLGAVDF
ncbi:hypothetical protein [Huintestinicola sp.]|uniref:hypothetical protein n=1 Tax=Huintestinicola sp. TaxID=2981661 RepID=UPI003D7D9C8E